MNQNQILTSGRNIVTALTVLQVLTGLGALVGLLFVFLAFSLGGLASLGAFSGQDLAKELGSAAGGATLLGLYGLLILANVVIYLFLIAWIKGWIGPIGRWAAGQGSFDPRRIHAITETLGRWIVFFQWAPLLAIALFVIGALVISSVVGMAGGLLSNDGGAGLLAGGAVFVFTLIAIVTIWLPGFLINLFMLGWIRRWMVGVTDRALGRPSKEGSLEPLSRTLSGWFTFFQVLTGLVILFSLLPVLVPTDSGLFNEANSSSDSPAATLAAFILTALFYGLYIALLQWSKTYMQGVTGVVDRMNPET
ncbi:hypothetical protein HNR42_002210 [Deinobacterium chartae]|uniref:Uncharacterized protein n=1 Tax=Deinobacterium chartae TaxID=521158 RepID=A0A841I4F2_9DEIO|nr:hypothetical protein [Deinobacterium chartae]MBB6098775.1 hypothetical protein [Deinobacterium chartae]